MGVAVEGVEVGEKAGSRSDVDGEGAVGAGPAASGEGGGA